MSDVVRVIRGPVATVYRVPLPTDQPTAAVSLWLLDAPNAHPAWRFHSLIVVHLREVEGVPAPVMQFAGASHELMVYALDPDHDDEIMVGDPLTQLHYLTPPDAVVQFIVADDEQARSVAAFAAHAVAHGLVVPDADFREDWEKGVAATSEHVRLGEHPDR